MAESKFLRGQKEFALLSFYLSGDYRGANMKAVIGRLTTTRESLVEVQLIALVLLSALLIYLLLFSHLPK
jgi:hypothetical protein